MTIRTLCLYMLASVGAVFPQGLSLKSVPADSGYWGRDSAYLVMVDVANNSNSERLLSALTCGYYSSFVLKSSQSFTLIHWPCDANFPVVRKLAAHKRLRFPLLVKCDSKESRDSGFTIGFLPVFTNAKMTKLEKGKDTIWGNRISVSGKFSKDSLSAMWWKYPVQMDRP